MSAAGSEPRAGGEDGMLWAIAHTPVQCLAARAKDHFSPYVEERRIRKKRSLVAVAG